MRRIFIWGGLIFLLFLSPFWGQTTIPFSILTTPQTPEYAIFMQLRVPRIVLAFGTGALLALSGLVFQTLFRNALMTPYTLGVSSGAVLGAGIGVKLGLSGVIWGITATTITALAGAWGTVVLIVWLATYIRHRGSQSLLLLGIALSFFYTSALMVLFYLSSYVENHEIMRFTMGSLSIVGFGKAWAVLGVALLLFITVFYYRSTLGIVALSQSQALQKGIRVTRLQNLLLGVASMAVGVAVSIVGPIGFVGLVVPHWVARFYATSIEGVWIPTFFAGGFFLVACDTLSRVLSGASELPIGVVTGMIGAPFFMWILLQQKD